MSFLVIPSIDIKNGKTVRTVQGIPELGCAEYCDDPLEMAMIWRSENAKMIHVVDFDGIGGDTAVNHDLIKDICTSVIIPVEFTGGIRSVADADFAFSAGVSRIVVASIVIQNRKEFYKIFEKFGPSKVVVGIDVIDNEVVIKGRQEKSGIAPADLAEELASVGVSRFIVCDVLTNGMLTGPNIQLSKQIAERTGKKVTHSGGVTNKDDLAALKELLPLGVDSVIIGRALYENKFPCQKIWRLAEVGIYD
ncbi:MAG: 1-(5-phosphoribosyl)-5-[(5-phosphoribosylamino)methylideneamino] imidazole-4-carboxamide isomerase [Ignavibacteriales bacterium]|jgi:Phosphoribosylformimino-5-aminoimidazole carboxamide ribonucleotide (ProFAR) isomerase|nr:MAG: 1-(5-phosphoribosyl)-5-[(5-phosphoribosylamino)methylideneamino] imidazole-4-carboxamide isomerase [Ignavibacteriaceae bacterium]MBW7872281.1 1-(5-phosphoribosyl)-5-[(5-phosphoribosylamino)methylideneamino] imidazole-4-carboxamide isomerase [Ignavibacteria bacterium]MCZ2142563.1 1-(5-phosphoribosyl)-5-[(5-phosphoribosylamino)methylideneamino] imidazole-4-carboxamide isomerase [Ignavibacteriales bacterium]OQY79475.1 MAG: 1-(5-phosphoribosyl)-5-((5-phosphoribosylamino)methylideneamino)imid